MSNQPQQYFVGIKKGKVPIKSKQRLVEGKSFEFLGDPRMVFVQLPTSDEYIIGFQRGALDKDNLTKFLNKETFEFNGRPSDFVILSRSK